MKIRLLFPPESIEAIQSIGLRQRSPEVIRWTTEHPASSYGQGVLLRGKSGEILDGKTFAILAEEFGAWIEVDSERTKNRVMGALATAATPRLDERIVVKPEQNEEGT